MNIFGIGIDIVDRERINKIYGGEVTIDKCKKLKARPKATPRDKQLCNFAKRLWTFLKKF